jgi:peptide/nickel transport system substrate-binding protein/oligopeptide transport system substrate-binding protein
VRTVLGRLALVATLAAGCAMPLDPPPAGEPDGGGPPRTGGVFRLAEDQDPRTLDPALGYDSVSWTFEQMIFSTLVDYDEQTSIVPAAADRWEMSPDAREFRFQLRSDVRFSTGRPATSADVRYSIERVLRPELHSGGAAFFTGLEGAGGFVAGQAKTVTGIRTPAPDRVEFRLDAPDVLFLHKLTMPFAAIVDREAVERIGDKEFARRPVGTGPFVLQEWVYGQRMRLARNPHYFKRGLPYLDGVEATIGVSDQLEWFKYQRGEIDVAGIPMAEFARVTADARYRPLVQRKTTLRTHYLGLNCELPPFDRVEVRQAMNLAIDKVRVVELMAGRGVAARSILPPDMPGHDRDQVSYPYDPAAAGERIAAAGFHDRIPVTLWATRDDTVVRIAQSVQRDLKEVGIDLAIKPVDFPALIEAVRNPKLVPVFLLGWEADFPDPSNFLNVLLHSRSRGTNNNTFYSNPDVDRLLDQADAAIEPARRLTLFHAAEAQIMRDAPWVPLFHPVAFGVRHPRVRDNRLHPLRPPRLESVWVAW